MLRLAGLAALLAATTACLPQFDDLEEACLDALPGEDLLGGLDPTLAERVNCYRRYVGVWELGIDSRLQESARQHLAYMALNDVLEPTAPAYVQTRQGLISETSELPGWLADTPYGRAVKKGAVSATDALASGSVWGWFVHDARMPAEALVANPYARDALFQPLVLGAGFAQRDVSGALRAYFEVVTAMPSGVHTGSPIAYPKDGQEGVPTGWRDPWATAIEPLKRDVPWGFPITLTFSADSGTSTAYDPFGLRPVDILLVRDEDDVIVDTFLLSPRVTQPVTLRTTVVVVPKVELAPQTTYRLTARVDTVARRYDTELTFTTGAARVVE